MKKFYTQNDIDKFLSEFRNFPEPYKLEMVHQLLKDPSAVARHRIKLNYKHLNLIIMTSSFIVGLIAFISGQIQKKPKLQKSKPSLKQP